jgi:predicted PurR-regulated permease PerM
MNALPAGRSLLRWFLLLVLFAFVLKVAAPFIEGLLWALVFVIVAWPVFCYLRLRAKLSETMAAFSLCGTATVALILVVFPLLFELTKEVRAASVYFSNHNLSDATALLSRIPYSDYLKQFLPKAANLPQLLGPLLENSGKVFEFASLGFQGLGRFVFNLCMGLFLAFFLFRDGEKLRRELRLIMTQVVGEGSTELTRTALLSVRAAFYGTIVTAFVQGLLAGIGYWLFGVPMPALWGLITMCTSLIPFGSPLMYVPIAIYLAIGEAGLLAGALLLAWGVLLVSMVDNVCRPFFMSHSTQMPLPIVLIGVVGGLLAFGMIGIFIGPPLVGIVLHLYHAYVRQLREQAADVS